MKKKSNANLAFIGLRVLPGFVVAAFIAFALASFHAVGDTSSGTPSPYYDLLPLTPCDTPSCTPSPPYQFTTYASDGTAIRTDLYTTDLHSPKPVLVIRGDRDCVPSSIWSTNSEYNLLVQEFFAGDDSSPVPYNADRVDGQALLASIAQQHSWCNGRIWMQGWSATAIPDYLAAPGATPALVGIQTNYATGDLLNYGMFNGGVLHREVADLVPYPEGTSWEDYVGLPIWGNYLITNNDASLAHAAGLERSGWFDVFCQGTLDSFSRLQTAGGTGALGRQKVVIYPGGHGGGPVGQGTPFPNTTDPRTSEYNTDWLNGVDHGNWAAWDALPAVRVYLMNASRGSEWTSYDKWPPPGIEYPLYFASGDTLSNSIPAVDGQVTFTSDPNNPCPTLGGTNNLISCVPCLRPNGTCGSYDQRSIEGRSDVLVFTSLAGTALIVGRIHADVWIQTALPDVDVFVRMTDVYPPDATHRNERSMLMAQGIQRARYRNGACPQPLPSNTPTLVRVDLSSTALGVPAGHKIRVIVSAAAGPSAGSTYPLYSINPQNGDEYVGPHPNQSGPITVLFERGHYSALFIPVPTGTVSPPDRRPNTTPCLD